MTVLLALVTFGFYFVVWHYKINRELNDQGERNSPALAALAVSLGGFLIVPPFVSIFKTAGRIRSLQGRAGISAGDKLNPSLMLALYAVGIILIFPFLVILYLEQKALNKVWQREPDAPPLDAAGHPRLGSSSVQFSSEIHELEQLRRAGLITDKEFQAKKASILNL